MTTKETFLKLQHIKKVKAKNEASVPLEQLQGKYKTSYEKLCNEVKNTEKELRIKYIDCIRILSEFAAETVYMNLNEDEGWEQLVNSAGTIFEDNNKEPMLKYLLIGFCNGLDEISKKNE